MLHKSPWRTMFGPQPPPKRVVWKERAETTTAILQVIAVLLTMIPPLVSALGQMKIRGDNSDDPTRGSENG